MKNTANGGVFMSVMKYENGFLKIKKDALKGIDINDIKLVLYNKTNGKIAEAVIGNTNGIYTNGIYIDIQNENFSVSGNGYYIAVLSRKSTETEIEKYGFYYGNQIIVSVSSKVRQDSKGITRCYLKLESTDSVPENRIYLIFNNNAFFKLYFGGITANKPVYYTFQKPEKYGIYAEELDIDEDVVTVDGSHKIQDIKINNRRN